MAQDTTTGQERRKSPRQNRSKMTRLGYSQITATKKLSLLLVETGLDTSHWYSPVSLRFASRMTTVRLSSDNWTWERLLSSSPLENQLIEASLEMVSQVRVTEPLDSMGKGLGKADTVGLGRSSVGGKNKMLSSESSGLTGTKWEVEEEQELVFTPCFPQPEGISKQLTITFPSCPHNGHLVRYR